MDFKEYADQARTSILKNIICALNARANWYQALPNTMLWIYKYLEQVKDSVGKWAGKDV
jgi:hypothetical protein